MKANPEKNPAQDARDRKAAQEDLKAQIATKFARFGYVVMPHEAEAPILGMTTRRSIAEFLAEQNHKAALDRVKVQPRKRVLLDGKPGCGKTSLAHFIAGRYGVPMLIVQASAINEAYIGQSAKNVAELFRSARQIPDGLVLFFDEFDAIARNRDGRPGSRGAHTEAQGVTIALLSELDRHEGIVFAATNAPEGIDPAVQRRFQFRMDIAMPGTDERFAIIKRYMAPLDVDDALVEVLAAAFEDASPALIKDMCEAAKRGLVLAPDLQLDTALSALMRRAMTSIKPHEDATMPKLWSNADAWLDRIDTAAAAAAWPPILP